MLLTRAQVRDLDRRAIQEYGVPGVVLMENAGRGAAELLLALGVQGPVTLCCGKGNNGGDGFVIARHLDYHHLPVRVLLFARPDELVGDALTNYQIVAHSCIPVEVHAEALDWTAIEAELSRSDWIVDALFGTGLSGPVRAPFQQLIKTINRSQARVFAVDIPSGLDCDMGTPLGIAIEAQHTATFVALKTGFANPAARKWLGEFHVLSIGLPSGLVKDVT